MTILNHHYIILKNKIKTKTCSNYPEQPEPRRTIANTQTQNIQVFTFQQTLDHQQKFITSSLNSTEQEKKINFNT